MCSKSIKKLLLFPLKFAFVPWIKKSTYKHFSLFSFYFYISFTQDKVRLFDVITYQPFFGYSMPNPVYLFIYIYIYIWFDSEYFVGNFIFNRLKAHYLHAVKWIQVLLLITNNSDRDIGPAVRVFANGPGDLGSIPGRVIPKTLKMELDTTLLNTQHYKVRFKGKVEQSWEWSSALPYTLV